MILQLHKVLHSICGDSDFEEALGKYKLTAAGWQKIELLHKILGKVHDRQQLLSAEQYPTLFESIPVIEYLQSQWEQLQDKYDDILGVHEVIKAGLHKLAIYYLKMEATNAYGNAMILTPYIKMKYLNKWWTDITPSGSTLAEEAKEAFIKCFNECYAKPAAPPVPKETTSLSIWGNMFDDDDDDDVANERLSEAEHYLAEPLSILPEKGGISALEFWMMGVIYGFYFIVF
ncbi:hypothetical protein M422DRAFT_258691 [Sphaerobolus stellatus SS14]|uniref:Uncharacterized protein n=1 Tax=Sphaerobolus stellatus (strain SS14) TaxID=990650 RepID=A0A0C9VLT1_SPHS4|nr:hypothetical protein M422DRAFT_258691 [Sphaerobolus stellatus SS14]